MTFRAYYICDGCALEADAESMEEPPAGWEFDPEDGTDYCPNCVVTGPPARPVDDVPDPWHLFTTPPEGMAAL